MEPEKSLGDYWALVKTWFLEHQHWFFWPFVQAGRLFQYAWEIIQSGSTQERLVLAGIILAVLLVSYVAFILGLREVLIRMPGFNRIPFGLPHNDDYQVKPTGYDRPVDFEWRYPNLWVGGTEFNFERAMLDEKDTLLFYLKTGTEVRFIPKNFRK